VLDPSVDPPRLLAEVSECIGVTTNNVAEYKALIAGLRAAAPYRARCIRVRADSKLVIEQVKGAWKVKQPHLRPLLAEARALLADYAIVDLRHVPRAENYAADALVNAALDAATSG
jgi:ribonuclease HI